MGSRNLLGFNSKLSLMFDNGSSTQKEERNKMIDCKCNILKVKRRGKPFLDGARRRTTL